MTYLKIENGKGFFLNENGEMEEIHEIRKEDILRMLDLATDNSVDFEMDEITDGSIQNEAHSENGVQPFPCTPFDLYQLA